MSHEPYAEQVHTYTLEADDDREVTLTIKFDIEPHEYEYGKIFCSGGYLINSLSADEDFVYEGASYRAGEELPVEKIFNHVDLDDLLFEAGFYIPRIQVKI